ncbi:Inositol hexakisphosphate and diphosphoinositol-pentakisphosphate kinase [Eumeta japonica]|uniref:Inositol hexakisphosphate and diphosphoinositol-pentakisphosphate kinase n=1 Tax=Eumeta variegata TaxID=151549 RepID=A0A4C1SUM6_EUMVA|nr:Inositol hexakisphosphate and diphosphoinositol-pentakisphosphate kinase [Eumeta japonica]
MEWSWLRDWWRLKKYRSEQRMRQLKCSAHDISDDNQTSLSSQHSNHHHHKSLSGSDFDEEDIEKFISDDDDLQQKRLRRHRRRLRLKRLTTIESVNNENTDDIETCKQDNENGNGENGINVHDEDKEYYDEGDDDEVDDFCYCDECLNGDTEFCENNDGMDSDASTSSNPGKQVVVGICAMAKKTQSKPMKEILTRLQDFEFIKMEPVENWPICDCLVSFHSKGFPLEKAIQYAQLRKPYVLNNLHMQYDIQDRRRVYAILEKEGIEIPRYAVLDRDSPDPKQHELIESEDHVEVNGITFNKPFVEKPVSAEDHNIYIYYPTGGGGSLFRKYAPSLTVSKDQHKVIDENS